MDIEKWMPVIVFLVLLLAAAIGISILVRKIKRKIRQVSNMAFGVDSLIDGLRQQEETLAVTPKSVSGMTRILEPQIQKDFPEFNWVQFRNKAENMLLSAFAAVSAGNASLLKEGTPELAAQVENQIVANEQAGIQEIYRDVKIHRTEITRYEKKQGKCIITLQSAVEYYHYRQQSGNCIEGRTDLLQQTKYNVELMYIQDAKAANMDKSLGMTCPHCGAPITMLGAQKRCEYCNSPVTPVNIQVWNLQRYYEVDYNHV